MAGYSECYWPACGRVLLCLQDRGLHSTQERGLVIKWSKRQLVARRPSSSAVQLLCSLAGRPLLRHCFISPIVCFLPIENQQVSVRDDDHVIFTKWRYSIQFCVWGNSINLLIVSSCVLRAWQQFLRIISMAPVSRSRTSIVLLLVFSVVMTTVFGKLWPLL